MKKFFNEEDKMQTASMGFGFITVLFYLLIGLQDRGDENVFIFLGSITFICFCAYVAGIFVYDIFYKLCAELLTQKWIGIATIILFVFFVGCAVTNNYGETPKWNL